MVSLEMFSPSRTWTSPAPFLKGGTPKLRELRADVKALDGLRFQPFPCLSTLQLETLNEGEFSWSIFLDLLALPCLQTLSIAGEIFQSPEATAKGRTVVAKQLKHFRCSDPEVFCNIWTFVEAPELELLIFIGTPLEDCIFPFAEADTKDDSAHGLFPSLHTLGLLSCQVNAEDTSNALLLAHATKSIQHLYVAQDEEGHDADRSVFHAMAEMGSTSIFWPNLKTLTCLLEMDSDSFDLEPASCLEIVECRAKKMQKHCTLRLFDDQVQWWRSSDLKSWKRLQEGGFYERIAGYCHEGDIDYVPWPPRATRTFHSSSEEHFLSHGDEYEEDD